MAYKSSAEKRNRQNTKRRLRNRMFKSRLKTMQKQFTALVQAKSTDEAQKSFLELSSLLDSGVSKGILHRSTVSRTKSRLHGLLNSIV